MKGWENPEDNTWEPIANLESKDMMDMEVDEIVNEMRFTNGKQGKLCEALTEKLAAEKEAVKKQLAEVKLAWAKDKEAVKKQLDEVKEAHAYDKREWAKEEKSLQDELHKHRVKLNQSMRETARIKSTINRGRGVATILDEFANPHLASL